MPWVQVLYSSLGWVMHALLVHNATQSLILMVAMDKRRLPMVYGWPPHVVVTLEQGEPVSRPRDVRDIRLCS